MKTFEQFDKNDPFGEEVGSGNIPPQPIEPEHVDHRLLFGLQRIAIDYVNRSYQGEEPDEDDAQEALEQVVQMFYGRDIFERLRELDRVGEDPIHPLLWRGVPGGDYGRWNDYYDYK